MFLWRSQNKRPELFQQMAKYSQHLLHASSEPCLICQRTKYTVHRTETCSDSHLKLNDLRLAINRFLCSECIDKIPWITHIQCPICGRDEHCGDCIRRKHSYFSCNRSAVSYSPTMKHWLSQYKYRKDERLSTLFILMISYAYERLVEQFTSVQQNIDIITFVPISKERLEERGFNQAEKLARGLGKRYHLSVLPLLLRTRHTHKQSVQSRTDRFINLQDVFSMDRSSLEEHFTEQLNNKLNVLLIDDIYTTGSTLNQCAKALISSLPANVYGLTWARSVSHD